MRLKQTNKTKPDISSENPMTSLKLKWRFYRLHWIYKEKEEKLGDMVTTEFKLPK